VELFFFTVFKQKINLVNKRINNRCVILINQEKLIFITILAPHSNVDIFVKKQITNIIMAFL